MPDQFDRQFQKIVRNSYVPPGERVMRTAGAVLAIVIGFLLTGIVVGLLARLFVWVWRGVL